MVPSSDRGRFFAFGRVFSGKIATGQKVRIMGPNYIPGKKSDLWVKNIQRTLIARYALSRSRTYLPPMPRRCDQHLLDGTISTHDEAHCIKTMKFSVSPVVRCAVEPKKAPPSPSSSRASSSRQVRPHGPLLHGGVGEHIIAATGELHPRSASRTSKRFHGNGRQGPDLSSHTASRACNPSQRA